MLKPEKDVKGCYTTDLWAFSKTNVLFPLSPPLFLKSVQVLSGLKVKLCENKPYIFIYRLNFTARVLLYETQHFHKIISLIKWFLFPANLTNSYAALLRSPHTWSLMRINLHLTNGITIEKISFHLLSVTERNGARAYHETAFYSLCDLTSAPKIKGHEVRSAWLGNRKSTRDDLLLTDVGVCFPSLPLKRDSSRKAHSDIRQKEVISGRFPITKSELARCCHRDEDPI